MHRGISAESDERQREREIDRQTVDRWIDDNRVQREREREGNGRERVTRWRGRDVESTFDFDIFPAFRSLFSLI